jgi:hypothetical protein
VFGKLNYYSLKGAIDGGAIRTGNHDVDISNGHFDPAELEHGAAADDVRNACIIEAMGDLLKTRTN